VPTESAGYVAQAFYLARTGRPGPVLIDVPKDVQQQLAVPDWDVPMAIAGYMARLPQPPAPQVSCLLPLTVLHGLTSLCKAPGRRFLPFAAHD
jgi:acetolactate synthase-1/2/3 large subunit